MIALTHLSGRELWVNPDLLQSMEATPDTMLVLVNGQHVIVREAPTVVATRLLDYRAKVMAAASQVPLPPQDAPGGPDDDAGATGGPRSRQPA